MTTKPTAANDAATYLTESAAAKLLGVSTALLARRRREGVIAHYRLGPRCVRYTHDHLADYRAQCERAATQRRAK